MDMEAPFPPNVDVRIGWYVTRWAVLVYQMPRYYEDHDNVLMVRYFKTRPEAISFKYSHTAI